MQSNTCSISENKIILYFSPPSYASETADKTTPLPALMSFQTGIGRPLQSDVRPSTLIAKRQENEENKKSLERQEERGRGRKRDKEDKKRSKSAYRRGQFSNIVLQNSLLIKS